MHTSGRFSLASSFRLKGRWGQSPRFGCGCVTTFFKIRWSPWPRCGTSAMPLSWICWHYRSLASRMHTFPEWTCLPQPSVFKRFSITLTEALQVRLKSNAQNILYIYLIQFASNIWNSFGARSPPLRNRCDHLCVETDEASDAHSVKTLTKNYRSQGVVDLFSDYVLKKLALCFSRLSQPKTKGKYVNLKALLFISQNDLHLCLEIFGKLFSNYN